MVPHLELQAKLPWMRPGYRLRLYRRQSLLDRRHGGDPG
jgi:hypothetical protein